MSGWESTLKPVDLPFLIAALSVRAPPPPSLILPQARGPSSSELSPFPPAPTLAEHSLFSLALGAQRARLSPVSRWQHLLLHWALFKQSSPSSCRAGDGGGVSPGPLPFVPPLPHPPRHHPVPLTVPPPVRTCVEEASPWGWRPVRSPSAPSRGRSGQGRGCESGHGF